MVTDAALDLLDEVGLDAVSTRRLAQRLGVEQPSLYWHFRNKEQLLAAMAEAAMTPHAQAPLPAPEDDPLEWFRDNARSLRRTLLQRRDGARLHAGSRPAGDDLGRIEHKLAFLTSSGVPETVARMALLAAGRFTVGSVLEEQADLGREREEGIAPAVDHEAAFEAGLGLLADGLARHANAHAHAGPGPRH
ncbi:TetR/AcrR family transcriptional regulator, tetracycline repressor protein [Microlunatus flavus]|uniref:TetR/AcrR family transcriptional regulator, tetracycline repressor protein n=1 Tax=Microlunatus flavus TaxID=1036181 RepID=A0A1H9GYH6_9ACTN|nr:TetR/AcrR family transcriptional regulator, tetracycline repressor protein [Microlunatus flavus]